MSSPAGGFVGAAGPWRSAVDSFRSDRAVPPVLAIAGLGGGNRMGRKLCVREGAARGENRMGLRRVCARSLCAQEGAARGGNRMGPRRVCARSLYDREGAGEVAWSRILKTEAGPRLETCRDLSKRWKRDEISFRIPGRAAGECERKEVEAHLLGFRKPGDSVSK